MTRIAADACGAAEANWTKYGNTRDPAGLERAKAEVQDAQRRNPDLAPVHRIAGELQANAAYYELAAAEYRRAIELDPNQGDAYRRIGSVYKMSRQQQEALMPTRMRESGPGLVRKSPGAGGLVF